MPIPLSDNVLTAALIPTLSFPMPLLVSTDEYNGVVVDARGEDTAIDVDVGPRGVGAFPDSGFGRDLSARPVGIGIADAANRFIGQSALVPEPP